jgi:hypothetical protein
MTGHRLLFVTLAMTTATSLVGFGQTVSPRTLVRRPDFQGTFYIDTLTPLERPAGFAENPFLTDTEARDYVQRRMARRASDVPYDDFWFERPDTLLKLDAKYLTSRIVNPPDGRIPALTPAAARRVAAALERLRVGMADGPEDRGLTERCISPAPTITTGGEGNYLQIVQTPDYLLVNTELMGVRRIIPIEPVQPLSSSIRSRSGISVGRWDGDTLVVDTTRFTGDFAFAFAAIDENLHQIERLRRGSAATADRPRAHYDSLSFVRMAANL